MIENLKETPLGYVYYESPNRPLNIEVSVSLDSIAVTVSRWNRLEEERLTRRSAVIQKMSKYQIEEYISDVVEIFIKKKKDGKTN